MGKRKKKPANDLENQANPDQPKELISVKTQPNVVPPVVELPEDQKNINPPTINIPKFTGIGWGPNRR